MASRGKRAPRTRPPAPEHPWDRQPEESAPAYQAFRAYLEMGDDRSIRAVGEELRKSRSLMSRWANKHRWVARVDAYEAEVYKRADTEAIDDVAQAIADRAKRQAEIVQLNLETAVLPGKELLERLQRDPQMLQRLDTADLIEATAKMARIVPRLVQAERLVRGQSTSNAGGHDGGPLTDSASAAARREAEELAAAMPDDKLELFLMGAEAQRQAIEERERKANAKA